MKNNEMRESSNRFQYRIQMNWDDEARVWIATSEDVPGLVLEDASKETLMDRAKIAIPELLELNGKKHGENQYDVLKPEITDHVVNVNGQTIVIRNVPCEASESSGEKYYSDDVAHRLERLVNLAKGTMKQFVELDYEQADDRGSTEGNR